MWKLMWMHRLCVSHKDHMRITRGSHEAESTIANTECNRFYLIIPMSLTRAPYKRKRRTKKNATLHEDDDGGVDTVTHVEMEVDTTRGPKTNRFKVPLRAGRKQHAETS